MYYLSKKIESSFAPNLDRRFSSSRKRSCYRLWNKWFNRPCRKWL